VFDEHIQLDEGVGVEERLQSLPGGQFARLVLLPHSIRPTGSQDRLPLLL